jgi:hypothetical protein
MADITMDIQDIKRAILRGGLDNLYLSNNPRHAISGQVNLDDMLVSIPGGIVRVGEAGGTAVPGEHVFPLMTPNIFPQAIEGLGFMEQISEGRTGVNRYFQGTDQNAMNKTASGIQQLSTMAAQRVELMARGIAGGVRDIGRLLHSLVLKSGHRAESIKLSGKWVEIDPSQWRKRTDFDITVAYAAGNKDALVSKLMMLSQKQAEALGAGLPIIKPENIYNTAVELTKAMDMSMPERFWTDPSQVPPQQPQPDPAIVMEQMKTQSNEKIKGAELQQRDKESQLNVQIEKYKTDTDAQTKLAIEQMRGQQAREAADMAAENSAGLEHVKAHLSPQTADNKLREAEGKQKDTVIERFMRSQHEQTQAIAQMFQHMVEQMRVMSGPKKVIRGKDGRAEMVVPASEQVQ